MTFSLRARIVFPVDLPPVENGVVVVEGERIVSIGRTAEGEVIDLGDVALLPAFINAHTHLEFSHLQRPLGNPGIRLVDWIRLVINERARDEQRAIDALQTGLRESAEHGVATVGDIATSIPGCIPGSDVTVFAEVIGFSRARAESAFQSLVERLDFVERALAEVSVSESKIPRLGISPHAPYTVSPELLERLVTLAQERDLPVAMHVAESREELELLETGAGPFQELLDERSMWDPSAIPLGSHPIDYLRSLSRAPRALVIHGNYLDQEELRFVGANRDRMSLVYCPRTHAYFGHDAYPLRAARAMRVRVALGTDSRASNPDLSILAEMRHVFRSSPDVDPIELLRMGTLSAAKALGRERDVGSLSPGKLANLVSVPIASSLPGTPKDVLAAIFSDESQPTLTCLAGRRLHA